MEKNRPSLQWFKEVTMSTVKLDEKYGFIDSDKIKYVKHTAFSINLISTDIDKYGNRIFTVAIDHDVKEIKNINELLKLLIRIVPLEWERLRQLTEDAIYNNNLETEITDMMREYFHKTYDKSEITVFVHNNVWDILKKIDEIDNNRVESFIKSEIKYLLNQKFTRDHYISKITSVFNKLSTVNNVDLHRMLSCKYYKHYIMLVMLDYITNSITDVTFDITDMDSSFRSYFDLLMVLARDMFYKLKIEDVLGIIQSNKAGFGPFVWLLFEAIYRDINRDVPLLRIEKMANMGDLNSNFFINKLLSVIQKDCVWGTYGENFDLYGEENFSQATGLYLSDKPVQTMKGFKIEPLSGSSIPTLMLDVDEKNLRTMVYRDLAQKLNVLEEDILYVNNLTHKREILSRCKHLMREIIDARNDDHPELDILQDKLQRIITTAQNCTFDTEAAGEGLIGDTVKDVIRIPTAIIDHFRAVRQAKQEIKERKIAIGKKSHLFKRAFMNIEEALDKCTMKGVKVGPVIVDLEKTYNTAKARHITNKMHKKHIYDDKRRERGYRTDSDRYSENYIDGMVNYTTVYVGEDVLESVVDKAKATGRGIKKASVATAKGAGKVAKGAVKGGKFLAQKASDAWRIRGIKMAFKQSVETFEYLMKHHNDESYDIERMALDHIEKWEEKLAEMQFDSESKAVVNALRKELAKYKTKITELEYKSKDKTVAENFNLAINRDKQLIAEAEGFIDDFFMGKHSIDYDQVMKDINERMIYAKRKGDMKKYDNLKYSLGFTKAKKESLRYVTPKEMKGKWKKDVVYAVFHSGKRHISQAIKIYQGLSPISHASLVINGKKYSVISKVEKTDMQDNDIILVYEMKPIVKKDKIIKFFNNTDGSAYAYWTIAKAFFMGMKDKNSEKDFLDQYFCSQWVIAAIDYATGKKLKFKGKKLQDYGYEFFTPQVLFNYMQESKELLINKTTEVFHDEAKGEAFDPHENEIADEDNGEARSNLESNIDDEGNEKAEAVEELEDVILNKLEKSNMISDDSVAENFVSKIFDGEKGKNYKAILKNLEFVMSRAEKDHDMTKYYKLLDQYGVMKAKEESRHYVTAKKMKNKWKKDKIYLVFNSGVDVISQGIKAFQINSPLSHAQFVINGISYGADLDDGVARYELDYAANMLVYEMADVIKLDAIEKFFNNTNNAAYGYMSIAKSLFLKQKLPEEKFLKEYFCSQWVIAAIDYATGKKLRYKGKKLQEFGYEFFTPQLLYNFLMGNQYLLKNNTTKVFK